MRGIARLQLAVVTMLCLGGGAVCLIPPVAAVIQGPFWFMTKVLVFLFFYVWMRGTLPRFRYDQLMVIRLEVSAAGFAREPGDHGVCDDPAAAGEAPMSLPLILFFVLRG